MASRFERTVLCAALLAVAQFSNAQDGCNDRTPVEMLAEALEHENAAQDFLAAVDAAGVAVGATMEDLPTSPSVAGAATASTIANFLPLFAFTGLGGDLEGGAAPSDVNDDMLAFDFNIPLSRVGASTRQLKLQAGFNRRPQLFEPLVEAVPSAERDALRTANEPNLTMTDDAVFSVVYNLQNDLLGRDRLVVDDVFKAAIERVPSADFQEGFRRVDNVLARITDEDKTQTFADMAMREEEKLPLCLELQSALTQLAEARAALDALEDLVIEESRIEAFAKLVNNQPQLYAGVTYRDRNPLVGANEKSISITYEWGYRANFNLLRKFMTRECGTRSDASCRLTAYREYVTTNAEAIEAGDRLKFSLEYADVDDLVLTLAEPALTFNKTGGKKLVATFAYGRSLTAEEGLFDSSRIDFEIKREDVDDDPDRSNRTIASLTVTRSIGDLAFPFSLVYANKPEFLRTITDDKLSAHFGVKYELAGK